MTCELCEEAPVTVMNAELCCTPNTCQPCETALLARITCPFCGE